MCCDGTARTISGTWANVLCQYALNIDRSVVPASLMSVAVNWSAGPDRAPGAERSQALGTLMPLNVPCA